MADILNRKRNAKRYHDDKAAQKNITADKEVCSEPSKVASTD